MKLEKITISGANEHTDIKDLMDLLLRYPETELGIQVSPMKADYKSKRYLWIGNLYDYARTMRQSLNIALHVNPGWVEQVCAGNLPLEILRFMAIKNHDGSTMVRRIQLNFLIGREPAPDMDKLNWIICKLNNYRFILTYNDANRNFIRKYYQRYGNCFDLLVDESHGEGKTPEKWEPVIFPDVFQSYSGGLSPDNIGQALDSIAAVNRTDIGIGIDAEGNLKGDDGHLSLKKAEAYLQEASNWNR